MSYQEYLEIYVQVINEELERRNIPGKARPGEQKKNGVVKKGICVDAMDGSYSAFYQMGYSDAEELLEDLIREEVEILAKDDVMDFVYDFQKGKDYVHESFLHNMEDTEFVKKAIVPYLFSLKHGDHLERNLVYREFLDMAIGYRVNLKRLYNIDGSFVISRSYAARIGLTEEDLYKIALNNASECIETISMKFICQMTGNPEFGKQPSDMMEIVRLDYQQYGAGGVLVKETLEKYAKENKTKRVVIIPSSIHECILIPEEKVCVGELKSLVREVNATKVEPGEVLSDSLYYYDLKKGYGKY